MGEPRVDCLLNGRRWTFDISDFKAASRLRLRVMEWLRTEAGLKGDFYAAELILGELLGNVARHTPGAIVVEADLSGAAPMLTVSDNGPGFTHEAQPTLGDILREDGRGMYLISKMAKRMEVRCDGRGATVRVELPLSASR